MSRSGVGGVWRSITYLLIYRVNFEQRLFLIGCVLSLIVIEKLLPKNERIAFS